jgi:hypothetical protein
MGILLCVRYLRGGLYQYGKSEVRGQETRYYCLAFGLAGGARLGLGFTDRNIPLFTFPADKSRIPGSCQSFCHNHYRVSTVAGFIERERVAGAKVSHWS